MPRTKEAMRAYMAERRARIRAEFVNLLGAKCVQCDVRVGLEFDHVDPKTKLFSIASGLDRPRAELLAEVAKCQLLCSFHHKKKTAHDGSNLNRAKGERSPHAKLTDEAVRDIRTSPLSSRRLAAIYGVDHSQIVNVRARRAWRHVT